MAGSQVEEVSKGIWEEEVNIVSMNHSFESCAIREVKLLSGTWRGGCDPSGRLCQ